MTSGSVYMRCASAMSASVNARSSSRSVRRGSSTATPTFSILATCEHVFVLYAELHSHSAFSFLDGTSLPEELAGAAVELGYAALALTDHNTVSGSMEFAEAAAGLGLHAIHGAEIDLVEPDRAPGIRNHEVGRHLTLLVEDGEGWRNLCRILTRAHAHTRDASSRRIEVPPAVPLEFVEAHAAGLVCLSGCATRGVHDTE